MNAMTSKFSKILSNTQKSNNAINNAIQEEEVSNVEDDDSGDSGKNLNNEEETYTINP